MDQVYYSASFYLKPPSSEDHQRYILYIYIYIMKSLQLELLAIYGDYLGQELQGIRANLKAAAISSSSKVQKAALEPDHQRHG